MADPNRRIRIEVDHAGLRSLIMLDLIRQLSQDGKHLLDAQTEQALRSIPAEQLVNASSLADKAVFVELNLKRLLQAVRRSGQLPEHNADVMYFLANGASLALIQRVFALDRGEVDRLARLARANNMPYGRLGRRQTLPHPDERDAMHAAWARIDDTLVKRYIALHRQFSRWPLAALDAVLNEFGA